MAAVGALVLLVLSNPGHWLTGAEGGCGLLVSERSGQTGMGGNGYGQCACYPDYQAEANGNGGWILPDPTIDASPAGWFYTAKQGVLSGGGTAGTDCAELFRYASSSSYSDAVIWTPPVDESLVPIPGSYVVEGARAACFGLIEAFAITITVSPPRTPNFFLRIIRSLLDLCF